MPDIGLDQIKPLTMRLYVFYPDGYFDVSGCYDTPEISQNITGLLGSDRRDSDAEKVFRFR